MGPGLDNIGFWWSHFNGWSYVSMYLHIWLGSKKSALMKHIGRFWKFFNIWWQREISYQSNLCNFPQILIELNCEGLRKLQMISKSRESTVEIFKHWMLNACISLVICLYEAHYLVYLLTACSPPRRWLIDNLMVFVSV